MVIIANSLFIAKSSTGCQKLFLLLGGLSSLHTKKNAYFLFKKNYFYTAQDRKEHEFLFATLSSTHSMFTQGIVTTRQQYFKVI